MTDNEIIKALVCCIANDNKCPDCPIFGSEICGKPALFFKEVFDLINRQQAEIERLEELLNGWKTEAYKVADEKDKLYCEAVERVKTTKSETIKEFAESVKAKIRDVAKIDFQGGYYYLIGEAFIDNIVEEMVGE